MPNGRASWRSTAPHSTSSGTSTTTRCAKRPGPRRARSLRVTTGERALGYGLFGRAATDGYVQRLAVDPEAHGRGLGGALVVDGLHWLRDRGALRAFVNTQSDNDRAYALYERTGFQPLPVGLCVLGRSL